MVTEVEDRREITFYGGSDPGKAYMGEAKIKEDLFGLEAGYVGYLERTIDDDMSFIDNFE